MKAHQEPLATLAQALDFGLSEEEFRRIEKRLGRTPTLTEAGVFSALWSEHCSYKSSRMFLRKFPTKGPQVVQGPGENAGAVDLGDGLVAVFKIESHNHPSFIEPLQGAATGVGGILRDIFTMGARPVALMNSLRFGAASHEKTPHLLRGVVKGIGFYGNAVGIPTVGGDIYFDPSYDGNILVNVFALGVCQQSDVVKAVAKGTGNLIVYLGAKTGRDGIHGATMASASFGEDSEEKRPTVQVGDPFKEKLLLEACLEMFQKHCLVGIQDMGAAGLSSSSAEMAARGKAGLVLDCAKVPQREPEMTPYEMMLSESQERMLICCEPGQLQAVEAVATKWGLDCCVIGEVSDDAMLTVKMGDVVAARMPVAELTDEAPVYERPVKLPTPPPVLDVATLPDVSDVSKALLTLMASPNLCSRQWVFRQYDQDVGILTVRRPEAADAGVVRLDPLYQGRKDGLAMTVDVNARYVKADPRAGAIAAAAEAYRNLAATGARPLAITDCLNFGSPLDPIVMGQFAEACAGLSDAARGFETPIVSGNVSLYNQTGEQAIDPTPTVAMVGHILDITKTGRLAPRRAGLDVWLISAGEVRLDCSEYLWTTCGQKAGRPPLIDIATARAVSHLIIELWEASLLESAHDVSDGGLLAALADVVLGAPDDLGLALDAALPAGRRDVALFGEGGTRFVLTAAKEDAGAITAKVKAVSGAALEKLGQTALGGASGGLAWPGVVTVAKAALESAWLGTMPRIAEGGYREGVSR